MTKPLPVALKRHPLSSMFGDMPARDLKELREDISKNGLLEAITLHEGMVLDGWHRYVCLCELGIKLKDGENCQDYDPDIDGEVKTFVLSKNIYRRQLSAGDRVRLVAKTLGYKNPGRGGDKSKPPHGALTMKKVAELAQVGERTAERTLSNSKLPHGALGLTELILESLEKRKKKLEKELEKVEEQIAALTKKKEKVSPKPVRDYLTRLK